VTSIYTAFFSFSAASYLALGAWVVIRQKNKVQQLYGLLCLTTCLWQAIWAILFTGTDAKWVYTAIQVCYSGIVLVPAIFHHFINEFTEQKDQKIWLRWTYGISAVLLACVWIDHLFLGGINYYSWGRSARAGLLHPIFSVLVTVVVVRTLILLRQLEVDPTTSDIKRRQTALVKIATYLYLGGAIDLLCQYGISVFPFSFLFTGASVLLFGYSIFRYEFLKMAAAPETQEELSRRHAASEEMKKLGMAAAFPLVSQGEVLGYLLLGEKMSEESYSKEDLRLLRIVANQAALASQRVRYLEMAVHGARTEMLGEIAGGFAHEIKTPLANISLPAELSIMDILDVEQGRKKLEDVLPELKTRLKDIMQQTFKASEKIEAIRQFSKPGQVQLEAVDLSSVLQGSLGLLDHLLRKTNTKVKAEFPPVMSPIRGDAKQLEIVFVNLIKNAAEAMALHTSPGLAHELVLKGAEDGNWVIASIKDSGPGIKRTDVGHLFEAYFTTKGSAGTGMGLFLSRQVIKAHGGQIDVKSEEGKGTEFIIRLPKYSHQEHSGVHKAA
jgi:signal transduction histidine kinase